MVMEYIVGGSLDNYILSRGGLPEKEALTLFSEICVAVEFIHQNHMLHLDIKPNNIIMDEEGHPHLIDFGLSKQYTEGGKPESSTSIGLGTPGYAPMEQAERFDDENIFRPTIDIYALGATLYKMLTGETPPVASKISESAWDGENIITTSLLDKGVSEPTAALVFKAMWPSSKKRYQSTTELISAINVLLEDETPNTETVVEKNLLTDPCIEYGSTSLLEAQSKTVKVPRKALLKWLLPALAVFVVGVILFLIRPKTVFPTSISLNKTVLILELGDSSALKVICDSIEVSDKKMYWRSSNNDVAVVNESGLVTTVNPGNATIIVTYRGMEDYCNLNVLSSYNGHEWVDLGLSVKWATCNVGASKSEGYGDYYAWGETRTKSKYGSDTYLYCNGSSSKLTKYCSKTDYGLNGFQDTRMVLESVDDVARQVWGGKWRMPTVKEFRELMDSCKWSWFKQDGMYGYKITSIIPGYENNSIFLPAIGDCEYTSSYNRGSGGYYWSSSLDTNTPNDAYCLNFEFNKFVILSKYRHYGLNVRPVCP